MAEEFEIKLPSQPNEFTSVSDSIKDTMQKKGLTAKVNALQQQVLQDAEVNQFIQAHQPALTQAVFNRDFATIFEYVNQRNKQRAGDAVVHDGYEPHLVFSNDRILVTYTETEAHRQANRQAVAKEYIHLVGMSKQLRKASLTQFADVSGMSEAWSKTLKFITAYLADPEQAEFHRGLYLHGAYGIGKTYLMGAMANELAAQKIEVSLIHVPTLATELKALISGDATDIQNRLRELREVPVLVLDDIGAEADGTGWIRDDVLGVILDARMQNELPTFFTSNFSMADLESQHFAQTKQGIQEVKAERLMQRIMFLAEEVNVTGPNRRLNG